MRRDVVTEVVLDYGDHEEACATEVEAAAVIEENLEELGLPERVWLQDTSGRKKWYYDVIEGGSGVELVSGDVIRGETFFRPLH